MILLIVLSVIGGLTTLASLYVLSTYVAAFIVGHTKLFGEKVKNIENEYKNKKAEKTVKSDLE